LIHFSALSSTFNPSSSSVARIPHDIGMCGLVLSIHPVVTSEQDDSQQSVLQSLIEVNRARGPDTQSTYTRKFSVSGGDIEISLSASVLGLRGGVIAQPLIGDRGVLAWNGQVLEKTPTVADPRSLTAWNLRRTTATHCGYFELWRKGQIHCFS
jgi:asparagine synthetase B (glutamine-hydrolysing)